MDLTLRNDIEGIEPKHLEGFFDGWPNKPSAETHLRILEGSRHVVVAWSEGRVVGFCTAVGDGVLTAYIPLLEVLPEFRGKGLGSTILSAMLDELKGLYMVDLVCDLGVASFYTRFGMRPMTAMCLRDYDRQSGRT